MIDEAARRLGRVGVGRVGRVRCTARAGRVGVWSARGAWGGNDGPVGPSWASLQCT